MNDKRTIEEILAELGRRMDVLVEETRQAGAKVSMEEKIAKLKRQKEKLENEIKNRSAHSAERWLEARQHLNDAASALNKAFNSIFK